ncbi:MAG: hypothetical protein JSR37_01410 [Verrucomicrobia bacterium]|nr:hypothetical protein [Verrucomicrobiota bacterium]MBS0636989.1 hypothetical protein [Verrucomicrobiota bacterium]
MTFSVPLPPDASDEAVGIWRDIADSLTVGDIEKLHDAVKDFISLSVVDKKKVEDMASLLPYPGLPSILITQIFSNPEATVGIIERLGSGATVKELGTAEQAVVLDALIGWLKADQKIGDIIKVDPKVAGAGAVATSGNPINAALLNFISSAGTQNSTSPEGISQANTAQTGTPLSLGSLQFLKNNAIALAGLNIADPTLLNQAYQIASQQLLITLLPDINTSNLTVHPTEQSRSEIIQKRLIDDIRKALQENAIPLNMQTFLVLWTAISLPQLSSSVAVAAPTAPTAAAATASALPTTLPASPIITSVLAALPIVVEDKIDPVSTELNKETPELAEHLGMLSYIYTQMAPYWSGPAAVSLMAATALETNEPPEQKKLESAVRAFAIAIGALLNDPHFDQLLLAIIKKEAPTTTQEQLKIFIAAMKISLLTNALVALQIILARKTNGQFKADELLQLILGPPVDDRSDLDELTKGLIKSIQTELRAIPSHKHADFLSRLLASYDENTDINSLVDPTKQFLNLCDTSFSIDSSSSAKC